MKFNVPKNAVSRFGTFTFTESMSRHGIIEWQTPKLPSVFTETDCNNNSAIEMFVVSNSLLNQWQKVSWRVA